MSLLLIQVKVVDKF